MSLVTIIEHRKGSPGFRYFGLGPNLYPCRGIQQLIQLFNENAFWARDRHAKDIKTMLKNSDVVVSLWSNKKLIGFGRSKTDGIYRAVLWDIVISNEYKGSGNGTLLINKLVNSKGLRKVKKIYIMTTNYKDFYAKNGFNISYPQILMHRTDGK
tara:strand:+ start:749 stop:1210 length:462 start_codon:yes stop_codon:yes gene_type:complete